MVGTACLIVLANSSGVGFMAEIEVVGRDVERGEEILTEEALGFVGHLHEQFARRRDELLAARAQRRAEASRTGRLDFLPETADVRSGEWRAGGGPGGVGERRGEDAGPTRPETGRDARKRG